MQTCLNLCVAKKHYCTKYMKSQNQKYQKEEKAILSTEEVAAIAECSPSLVRQVRAGGRNAKRGKGAKVAVIDDLAQVGKNALIEEIKRVVRFD